mmetsp:Transcript_10393/g.34405  ORF Transcript_10393/g.34405 Transcript_10393/m.34405 type:complete len:201 (-) Transcript_10393:4515-5117(-)
MRSATCATSASRTFPSGTSPSCLTASSASATAPWATAFSSPPTPRSCPSGRARPRRALTKWSSGLVAPRRRAASSSMRRTRPRISSPRRPPPTALALPRRANLRRLRSFARRRRTTARSRAWSTALPRAPPRFRTWRTWSGSASGARRRRSTTFRRSIRPSRMEVWAPWSSSPWISSGAACTSAGSSLSRRPPSTHRPSI